MAHHGHFHDALTDRRLQPDLGWGMTVRPCFCAPCLKQKQLLRVSTACMICMHHLGLDFLLLDTGIVIMPAGLHAFPMVCLMRKIAGIQ